MNRNVLQFFPDIEEDVIKAGRSTFKIRFSSTESVETKKSLMLKKWTLNYFKDDKEKSEKTENAEKPKKEEK